MLICLFLLISLGVAVIYSSSPELAIQQVIFALIGLLLYMGLDRFDYRSIKPVIIYSYILVFILLIITFILGIETRGSVRWIPIGPFNLQPSEFAKPVLILALAAFWSTNHPSWKNIFKSLLIAGPIILFVFRQPDLGTALTLSFIWFTCLVASKVSIKKLLILLFCGILILPSGWFFLQDYQKQRVYSFLSPAQDPQGIGFHVIQSTIAVGSGEIFGRGLGRGTQSRLQFLPEFRTDFIFAFIAEELGFIGSLLVLSLYAIIFYLGFRLLSQSGDRFGELITLGVLGMLFFQMAVNIGMNIGILPITGITLPLLSYGGSSVITTFIAFGLLASFKRYGLQKRNIDMVFK